MKKMTAAMLAGLMLCSGALAMENLYSTALVGDGLIYYAGSLDGTTQGVFAMDPDGGNAQLLFAGDATLMAGNDQSVMLQDFGVDAGESLVVLGRDGSELSRTDQTVAAAIESQGKYYAGPPYEATDDQRYLVSPVCAQDGQVYYLDSTRYGGVSVEGGISVGKLVRYDEATGESMDISPEGTSFIGLWEGRAVYTRNDFFIYEGDDVIKVEANPGLYLAGEDGQPETLLAPVDQSGDGSVDYDTLSEGVVYGMAMDYTKDPVTAQLKRVTVQGEVLPDIDVPYATIGGVKAGMVYLFASHFDEEGGFTQADQLIRVDANAGAWTQLNPDRQEALCFSEMRPRVALYNDRIYYLDFDNPRSATRLCSVDMNGGDHKVLAQGYSWVNVP